MNKKTAWLLAGMVAGTAWVAEATYISDPVEGLAAGWTNISGGTWTTGAVNLLPVEGAVFFTAVDYGSNNRGAWKLFTGTDFVEETLGVSYWVGDRTNRNFSANITPHLFADVNNDGLWQIAERIVPILTSRPVPVDGWTNWVDTYNIDAATLTAGGSNVLGKTIGFYVRVAGEGAGVSINFDSLLIETTTIEPEPVPDNLLVGWDTTGGDPDHQMAGVTGTLFTARAYAVDATGGSSDGTFGSTNSGASLFLGAYAVRASNPGSNDTLEVQLQNLTGAPLRLDSISFDYTMWFNGGPKEVTLSYAYGDLDGITNTTVIQSATDIPSTGKVSDYNDFDWSLEGLPDRVLANGEKATFALVAGNTTNLFINGAFDNIAIFGGPGEAVGYDAWAADYGLEELADGDDDDDGLSNLYEYGLGGDPTNGLNQGTSPVYGTVNVGGTNYFGYIHPQLAADQSSGLTYYLKLNTDLVYGTWTNAGYAVLGTNVTGGPLDFVTNVTDMAAAKKYIRLIIE